MDCFLMIKKRKMKNRDSYYPVSRCQSLVPYTQVGQLCSKMQVLGKDCFSVEAADCKYMALTDIFRRHV